MYYTFSQALALLNQKLAQCNIVALSETEAKDWGIVDDMTEDGINDTVREIRFEEHSTRNGNHTPDVQDYLEFVDEYDNAD
jgi:hypothetical protein